MKVNMNIRLKEILEQNLKDLKEKADDVSIIISWFLDRNTVEDRDSLDNLLWNVSNNMEDMDITISLIEKVRKVNVD